MGKIPKDLITERDVEIVVERALGFQAKVIKYLLKTYSEENLGFLGSYYHLAVTVQKENSKIVRTFFFKSVPHDNDLKSSIIEEFGAFDKETNFYKKILPELLKSVKDKSWIPECYLVKKNVLALEDLETRNFKIKGKILDALDLQSALTGLAKLHASSILAEKRLGKKFNELFPELFRESLFVRGNRSELTIASSSQVAVAVAKSIGLDHRNIPEVIDRIFEMANASKKWRNVVCHGDTKSFNLMFDDSKPIPKCALVDFQLIRYVPATTDLLQMFYMNISSRDYREKNEGTLLRHYHQVFCETLRDNDLEIELPSFEAVLEEYEDMRLFGLITATLYSHILFMDDKIFAELTKDSDGYKNFMFGNRDEITLRMMRENPAYRILITEIITELVQRSSNLFA